MLKHYLDITLQHSHEINQYFVLQKVFQQLHLGFVETQDANGVVPIGISFPNYHDKEKWGSKLRLLSTAESVLEKFNTKGRLARFSDYVHITGIRAVPERANSYALYQRQQPKTASDLRRLVKRLAKRENITIAAAEARMASVKMKLVKTPYINVCSASSGQRFRLFIMKKEAEASVSNGFNSYGLSKTSTVPEF